MKALEIWPIKTAMHRGLDKRPFLEEFRSKGFFLIDTCQVPVDKLPAAQKKHKILREASGLALRAEDLHPDRIIIVKKTVYQPVREALERTGLGHKILNNEPLKFPSHGNQKDYRSSLRRLLRKRGRTREHRFIQ